MGRGQFEHVGTKEDEYIATCFLQVNEIVNVVRGLGEKIENLVIVKKILRTLPMRFDPKILSLEEINYLATLNIDKAFKTLAKIMKTLRKLSQI
jgi:hypothetical protein